MRCLSLAFVGLLGAVGTQAVVEAPSGLDPVTRALPGHAVGVGDSLPRSNTASTIERNDRLSNITPCLPASAIGDDARMQDDLRSVERTVTRLLSRSAPQDLVNVSSNSQPVSEVLGARRALGDDDGVHAIQIIDVALAG